MSDYNNNGWGCGGGCFDIIVLLLFFGLMGGGMWGGLGGGFGFGAGGAGALGLSSLTAAETSQMIQQDNLRATAANTNAKLDWVTGIASSNAAKIESVKDAVTNGFFAEQTNMCQLGNNLNNAIRDNRDSFKDGFTTLQHQIASTKCDIEHQMDRNQCATLQAIASSKAEILGVMQQEKIACLEARNLELKGQLSQNAQTAQLMAAIQAGQGGCCNPCASPCNPCGGNLLYALNKAYADEIAQRIVNPPTTAAAAG
jgi:hypothetical protein